MQPTSSQFWKSASEIGAKTVCASIALNQLTPLPFTARLMYGTLAGCINVILKDCDVSRVNPSDKSYRKLFYSTGYSFVSWSIAAKALKFAEKQAPKYFARVPLFAAVSAACAAEIGALTSRSLQLKETPPKYSPLTEQERQFILELYKRVDA